MWRSHDESVMDQKKEGGLLVGQEIQIVDFFCRV